MLEKGQVEILLALRVQEACGTRNAHHRAHVTGQVRALVAVLTGRVPPVSESAADYLALAGIPHVAHPDGSLRWDDEWLMRHGFEFDPGPYGPIRHPDFPAW